MSPPDRRPVPPVEGRAREFWAHFDAKDHLAMAAMMTEDALETDDLAKGWLRGPAAIAEHFAGMWDRFDESHTALEDVQTTQTSGIAVVTCVVHYQMNWDAKPGSWQWPTTMIFVRETGGWKLALLHTK